MSFFASLTSMCCYQISLSSSEKLRDKTSLAKNLKLHFKLRWFPQSPQWITFEIFILQKILLNIKDVEFDFRVGCTLV